MKLIKPTRRKFLTGAAATLFIPAAPAIIRPVEAQFGGCLPALCATPVAPGCPPCAPIVTVNTKTIDGTAGGQFTRTNTGTITLTTTQTNDVAVLIYYHESDNLAAETIASVTSPNLTWVHHRTYNPTVGGNPWDFEIWYAPAPVAVTAELITITLTGTIDGAAYHAFGVNGCPNISSPWDPNCTLLTSQNSVGPAASNTVAGVDTCSTGPMIIGFTGMANLPTPIIPPGGATPIRADEHNNSPVLFAWFTSFFQNFAVANSGASYTTTPTAGTPFWGMVIDALI